MTDSMREPRSGSDGGAKRFGFDLRVLADPTADRLQFDKEWGRAYAEFDPRLRDFFRLRVESDDDLKDLISHIWLKAFQYIRALRAPDALFAWLIKIGENKLKDLHAHQAAQRRFLQAYGGNLANEEGARLEENAHDHFFKDGFFDEHPGLTRSIVRDRIQALSIEDRRFLGMVAQGVPHEEVAQTLSLASPEASRQRYARLRRKLQGV